MFNQEKENFERFVQPLSLVVFVGLLILLFLTPHATGYTWTVIVPLVPVFIVIVGYNRWRNICPLAWFAKLGQGRHWFKRRRVPVWFENNFYLFQFSLLALAFVLRLYFLNSNALFLALFFTIVIVMAFSLSLVYAGKSWCNFFCPVGVVEKIYCGTNAHLYHLNSACQSCCACKKDCPDIDLENAYWKEGNNKQKHFIFYLFPGLVFGFYLSYFSQSGNWEYYFSGVWTQTNSALLDAGFYFLPEVPRLVAIPLTLVTSALISLVFFISLEKGLGYCKWTKNKDKGSRQHIMRMFAAFVAFNIFYVFAGAPAYLNFPKTYMLFHFLIVVVSMAVLYKEVFREEKYFLQERFARNMLKKWTFDGPAPKNLKEIYYTYSNYKQDKKNRLLSYEQSVCELMQEGVLKSNNMSSLDSLRETMGISDSEHAKVISSLEKSKPYLFDETDIFSAEKSYQLDGYKHALSALIDNEEKLPAKIVVGLKKEFNINDEEHEHIYKEIVNNSEHLKSELFDIADLLEENILWSKALLQFKGKELSYLLFVLKEKRFEAAEKLFNLLELLYPEEAEQLSKNKKALFQSEESVDYTYIKDNIEFLEISIKDKLLELLEYMQGKKEFSLSNAALTKALFECEDEELLSAILLASYVEDELAIDAQLIQEYESFKHPLVKEMAMKFSNKITGITTVEMMSYLHAVELFVTLDIDDLYELASLVQIKEFKKGEYLVKEDEIGNALYIITSGTAQVTQKGEELAVIKDGDYTGEIALITGNPRIATVQALQDLRTVELVSENFKTMIMKNPELSLAMMKEVTNRLMKKPSN